MTRLAPVHVLFLGLLFGVFFFSSQSFPPVFAQPSDHKDHHQQGSQTVPVWEGSPAGKAYSEFNHHLSGVFILVMGLAELLQVFGVRVGLLLPIGMFLSGLYLTIWSDHEAWPIGSLSFVQTFFGGDWEIMQHKVFGILPMVVGITEGLRRLGRLQHPGWRIPLPALAILGSFVLLLHSHGAHPEVHKIAQHHAFMGAMAVAGGVSKFASDWKSRAALGTRRRWGLMWSAFLILIGVQLLLYRE